MTEICKGMLVERRRDGSEPSLERVLAVDTSCSQVVTIQLVEERVLPLLWSYRTIVDEVTSGLSSLSDDDPYARLLVPDDKLSEAQRKGRDERWQIISQLPCDDMEFMVHSWKRGPLISGLAERSGKNKDYLYDQVRRYWQGGMVINALTPDLDHRGGPGKPRLVEEQDGSKFGRSSSLEECSGLVLKIKMTRAMRRCFERGIKKFLKKKGKKYQLRAAYDVIIRTYFVRTLPPANEVDDPILLPAEERPKFRQFEYWFRKYGIKIVEENRTTKPDPAPKSKAVLGDSTQMGFGPGSLYQIDATIAATYLVSSLDRTCIIGRPIIYFIMDVFSRMIVGMAVTLEGPSWRCAMLAVENIVENKVEFCRRYGIIIDDSEWSCQRLGNGFLADRGEFEGYNPDPLIKNCRQTVQNTPPYCGEFKGIIERNFGRAEERTIKFTPGYVLKDRRPGAPDYRLEAAATMYVFTRSVIRYVLWYNNNHYLKKYNMNEFAIRDKVERYPIDLWDWGIRNRSGNFGFIGRDVLRKNLLPHKEISITPSGIHLGNGLYYTCETAMREQWFDRAADRGRWKEVASYKLDSVDNIYLWLDGGKVMEECYLLDRLADPFKGKSWYEATDYHIRQLADDEASQTRRQQSLATLQAQNEREFAEEVEKTNAALAAAGPMSKRSRVIGIRPNRQRERELERQKIAANYANDSVVENIATGIPIDQESTSQSPASYVIPAEDFEELRELREDAWNDEA